MVVLAELMEQSLAKSIIIGKALPIIEYKGSND